MGTRSHRRKPHADSSNAPRMHKGAVVSRYEQMPGGRSVDSASSPRYTARGA